MTGGIICPSHYTFYCEIVYVMKVSGRNMIHSKWFGYTGVFALFMVNSAHANLLAINFEPIVGYEQIQQVMPTPHFVTRLIYGGRITAGLPLISAEGEYTHGMMTESIQGGSQTNTGDRAKVGLRSGIGF